MILYYNFHKGQDYRWLLYFYSETPFQIITSQMGIVVAEQRETQGKTSYVWIHPEYFRDPHQYPIQCYLDRSPLHNLPTHGILNIQGIQEIALVLPDKTTSSFKIKSLQLSSSNTRQSQNVKTPDHHLETFKTEMLDLVDKLKYDLDKKQSYQISGGRQIRSGQDSELNDALRVMLSAYQDKHGVIENKHPELESALSNLNIAVNAKIPALTQLYDKLGTSQDPFEQISYLLTQGQTVEMVQLFTELIKSKDDDEGLPDDQIKDRIKQIINVIWEKELYKDPDVSTNLSEVISLVDLQIIEPSVGSSFNLSEQKIVERVRKSSGMAHRAITEVRAPCIKVMSTGRVLDKAKVVIAD